MSRVQTNPLGVIAVRPNASPTNQFYQPEVREGKGASNTLLGLAEGLAKIDPVLKQFSIRRAQHHANEELAKGQADQVKHQIDSQEKFKEAVKNGLIPEHATPWYMIGIKKAVAAVEVDKAERSIFDAYSKNQDLQSTDDPRKIEAFADENFQGILNNRTNYELQAMAPRINEARNRLVTHHIQQRSQDRPREMALAQGEKLSAELDGFSKNPTPAEATDLQARIAHWDQETGQYLNRETRNNILVDTAKDAALATGNSEVFSTALASIKTTGGKTLADTAANLRTAGEIRATIVGRQAETSRAEKAKEKEEADEMAGAMFRTIIKGGLDVEANGWTIDRTYQMEAAGELKPHVAENLRERMLAFMREREGRQDRAVAVEDRKLAKEEKAKKAGEEAVEKGITDDLVKQMDKTPLTFDEMMGMVRRAPNLSTVQAIYKSAYDYSRATARDETVDDTEALREVNAHLMSGKLTPSVLAEYTNRLKPETIRSYFNEIDKPKKSATAEYGTVLTQEVSFLKDRILQGGRLAVEATDTQSFSSLHPDKFTRATEKASAAENQLITSFRTWANTEEGQNATPQQTLETIQKLSDQIGSTLGATTRQEFVKGELTQTSAAKTAPDKVEKPSYPVIAELTAAMPEFGVNEAPLSALKAAVSTSTGSDGRSVPRLDEYADETTKSSPFSRFVDYLSTPDPYGSVSVSADGSSFTTAGPIVDRAALRQGALKYRQALLQRLTADKTVDKFNELGEIVAARYNVAKSTGTQFIIFPEEKRNLINWGNSIFQYTQVTRTVGLTPEEAKKLGPGAYLSLPLFADFEDLVKNGEDVAKTKLGITDRVEREQFIRKQTALLHNVRKERANRR